MRRSESEGETGSGRGLKGMFAKQGFAEGKQAGADEASGELGHAGGGGEHDVFLLVVVGLHAWLGRRVRRVFD